MPESETAATEGAGGAFALAKDGSVRKVRLSYASGRHSAGSIDSGAQNGDTPPEKDEAKPAEDDAIQDGGAYALAKDGTVQKIRLSYASGRDSLSEEDNAGEDKAPGALEEKAKHSKREYIKVPRKSRKSKLQNANYKAYIEANDKEPTPRGSKGGSSNRSSNSSTTGRGRNRKSMKNGENRVARKSFRERERDERDDICKGLGTDIAVGIVTDIELHPAILAEP